jgi:uncharacterized protein (TIGR03437 family)
MRIRRPCAPALLFTILAATATLSFAQAPSVNAGGIVNHFSLAASAMPNGGIAQGSLFDINGKNLGPADPVQVMDTPLSAALAGVSAQVTVGGKTVDILVSSVSAARIVGLLPSTTPIGTGTLTVTVSGIKSATAPITVVKTSIGIQTANSNGYGYAAMNMSDGNGGFIPNSRDVTIQPGQTAVFLGTGAGAVPFDETTGAPMQDLDLDIHAYVGGQEAQILFKGRAPGMAGIDEFDVVIPDGLAGCNVSVIFVTGAIVSNVTSISVGDGGSCAGASANPLPTEGFLRSGAIELTRSISKIPAIGSIPAGDLITDFGVAAFSSIDYSKIVPGSPSNPATIVGPCIVGTLPAPPQLNNGGSAAAVGYLDAGASISIKGPNGTRTLAKQPTGFASQLGQAPVFTGQPDPGPPFVVPGDYTISNGSGGMDIAPFNVTFTIVRPAAWTNADALAASGVARTQGLDITWTPGADPEALISVGGISRIGNGQSPGGTFSCTVKEKDAGGHVTIPAIVLMVLPPSGVVAGTPLGTMTFMWSSVAPIGIPEIDEENGHVGGFIGTTRTVAFK